MYYCFPQCNSLYATGYPWDMSQWSTNMSYNVGYDPIWKPYPTWGTYNAMNMSQMPLQNTWFWDPVANGA